MANKRKLTIDKTYLSVDQAETRGFIHRDYIAHCLRWTHFLKSISENGNYKTAKILDVGCGRELPLAKTLYSSRLIPAKYVGVDVGPIEDSAAQTVAGEGKKFPCELYEDTDLLEDGFLEEHYGTFDYITCFEVLEHVEPDHMCQMLLKMRKLLTPDGLAFLSTPCWNVTDCAANHVDEMRYTTLGAVLEDLAFEIVRVHGTFASQRDYKGKLSGDRLVLFNELSEYYDSNFLSCIFAPAYPAESRNALWVVRPVDRNWPGWRFEGLQNQPQPYGSSDMWRTVLDWYPKILAQV